MKKPSNIIIVGAGLSGLYTALCLDKHYNITILAKTNYEDSNSNLAQGGIAAEMNSEPVNLKTHIDDTLKAGHYQNRVEAVKVLVEEAKDNIELLRKFNVTFDENSIGELSTTMEGGHSTSRILHCGGDATGKTMIKALYEAVMKCENITLLQSVMAVDILRKNNIIYGINAVDLNKNMYTFYANDIILATGGIGGIYASTTNDPISTGDGIAMAYRAGAIIEKMAFVQFHPTAFYDTKEIHPNQFFLISEALRGEGAILRNIENEAFMKKYHQDGDLAPRDVVSQAIHREMYDTWCDYVFLDTTHLERKKLQKRFPTIDRFLTIHGYKLGENMIPVRPVAHFSVGGIFTDINGETSIPHLYAVGECASTGVHGANRLASNSLLECVVFGRRIANNINIKIQKPSIKVPKNHLVVNHDYPYGPVRKKLRHLMDEFAGIVRTKAGLLKVKDELLNMEKSLKAYPNNTIAYYETINMVTVAQLVISDALNRPESIGCHFRLD
ncbi:MAG: L-aspartate oxidase [Acholeplasmataceae bacterium]|nr:L-aspartate oxidase [Acholeplasmataceae bacterium]